MSPLRVATRGYTDGAPNFYEPRLIQPGLFVARASGDILLGSGKSGIGEVILNNMDGGLNYLADYYVNGRAASVTYVDSRGVASSRFVGTCSSLQFDGRRVTVRLRDPLAALNLNFPQTSYLGNNALPAGLEGSSDDIKGQRKARIWGDVRNIQPALVNTARYIYEAASSTENIIAAVYDKGVALVAGADYSSVADMQANAPAAGQYRAYLGYFRVGAVPAGTVTCDAVRSVTLLGSVLQQLLAEIGYTVDPSMVTTLNSYGSVGLYLADSKPTSSLLDLLANSCGGYWGVKDSNSVFMLALLAPSSPVFTLYDYHIKKLTRQGTGGGPNYIPSWQVSLNADEVIQTQTDLASSVAASRSARMASKFRQATATSAGTQTLNPLSEEIILDTALRNLSDAQTRANALLSLLSVRRDTISCEVELDDTERSLLAIGSCYNIRTSELGYSAGRDMILIGYTPDSSVNRITLDLWG